MILPDENPPGRPGLCPACVKLFWFNPMPSANTIACPHCGQVLLWLDGEFEVVAHTEGANTTSGVESDVLRVIDFAGNPLPGVDETTHKDIDLATWVIPDDVLQLIPQPFPFGRRVVPLALERDGAILVAVADPIDFETLDTLQFIVNREVRYVVKAATEIAAALKRWYGSEH